MHYVVEVTTVLSGFLVPILAGFGVYIAWRQYAVARDKLRLDWYDKRFAVYQSLNELFQRIYTDSTITIEELKKFKGGTSQSTFLFDESSGMDKFLEEVYKKAVRLYAIGRKITNTNLPVGEERNELAEEESKILEWFNVQTDEAKKLFGKYLKPSDKS